MDGLGASRSGPGEPHRAAIGHSYGTTLIGAAARTGTLSADDVIFAGSPGVKVGHADEMNVPKGHDGVEEPGAGRGRQVRLRNHSRTRRHDGVERRSTAHSTKILESHVLRTTPRTGPAPPGRLPPDPAPGPRPDRTSPQRMRHDRQGRQRLPRQHRRRLPGGPYGPSRRGHGDDR
ncbi:alpha/beta hydrolase [Streptomyces sp. NRRL S-37]|uniref:alpha/beta hydrolase n=1 Tax=Streptomyces sp. NRRL S-37 TaxID=1463903 RepID=UPI003B64295A